jgi:large subunit ribosomal protein L35Ae
MNAKVLSFRRGRHTQQTNQLLVSVKDVENRSTAASFIGKKVLLKTKSGKEMRGKIVSPHGNNGVLRVRFGKGVPGAILGKDIEILK